MVVKNIEPVILSAKDRRKKIVYSFRCYKCGFENAVIKKDNKSQFGIFECAKCGHSEKVIIFYDRQTKNLVYYNKRHLNRGGGLNL